MNIEKLPSGSYRIRKTYKGKTYTVVTEKKPTEKEALILMAEKMKLPSSSGKTASRTFNVCASEYIENRENILSKSTLRSYKTMKNAISSTFGNINIYDIEQTDITREINKYAAKHSAKSVRNLHGFISAIIKEIRPQFVINTSLPQKVEQKPYRPTEDDVKRILEASKDDKKYHIAFQLGVMGLRRGELSALQLSDLKGNELTINKAMVETGIKGNNWQLQNKTKNDTSNRTVLLPDKLANEIRENENIFSLTPPMLVNKLHTYQDELGIPRFRFHDLRHYFASYSHSIGIPDVYIMETGGWKSTYTMNKIYKEAMADKSKDMKKKMADKLLS